MFYCKYMLLCITLVIVLLRAPIIGAATVESTFDDGLDGWIGFGVTLEHFIVGGNPDGFLRGVDLPRTSYVSAPAKFLGDLSVFDGGTLSFDYLLISSDLVPAGSGGNVTLRSNSTSVTANVVNVPSLPVPSNWTEGSIELSATAWGVDEITWSALLSNVVGIDVVIDPSLGGLTGNDIGGLDNFRIQAVPLPPSGVLFGTAIIVLVARAQRKRRILGA